MLTVKARCLEETVDKVIPTKTFYGIRHTRQAVVENKYSAQKLKKCIEKILSKPLPAEFRSRLDGPTVIWKIFKRQQHAIDYAFSHTKDALVFSYEERIPGNKGQRLYLVTHPKHMWLIHKARPPYERCSYEVISEGSPCKLYFDLEYCKSHNPNKDGNVLTDIFIKCVSATLLEKYGVKCEKSDVLWLDASTEMKFSTHLIFQIKNIAFKDNINAGKFASLVFQRIQEKIQNRKDNENIWPVFEDIEKLMIVTKEGNNALFCDKGVYTRNRNFRLYLSTKFGKNAPLLVSSANEYEPEAKQNLEDKEELLFLDSLITFLRSKKNRILEENGELCEIPKCKYISPNIRKGSYDIHRFQNSPFPDIDQFIRSIVSDDSKSGYIRRWTYFNEEKTLLYDIGNYRYCANIGRHHKSNNIMMMVELQSGVYYQRCYDPDCRAVGFRSKAHELPLSILPFSSLDDNFFEDYMVQPQSACSASMDTKSSNLTGNEYEIQNENEKLNRSPEEITKFVVNHTVDLMECVTEEDEISFIKVIEEVEADLSASCLIASDENLDIEFN